MLAKAPVPSFPKPTADKLTELIGSAHLYAPLARVHLSPQLRLCRPPKKKGKLLFVGQTLIHHIFLRRCCSCSVAKLLFFFWHPPQSPPFGRVPSLCRSARGRLPYGIVYINLFILPLFYSARTLYPLVLAARQNKAITETMIKCNQGRV